MGFKMKGFSGFKQSKADIISQYASSLVDAISENEPVYTEMRAQRKADRQAIKELKGTGASRKDVRAKRKELRKARKVKRSSIIGELKATEESTDE